MGGIDWLDCADDILTPGTDVEFEAEGHVYTRRGVRLPSVTQIIRNGGLMPTGNWLTDWTRDRGTFVHEATHLLDKGLLDAENLDPELGPYVRAWEKFKETSGCEIVKSEARFFDTRGFAGTADRVARWEDDYFLLDIKTGAFAPWHKIQLAAYGSQMVPLCRKSYNLAVYLQPDGEFKLGERRTNSLSSQGWAVFASALNLHNWKVKHGIQSNTNSN